MLHYLVVTGAGQDRTTASFNPVKALAQVLAENYRADPAGAAVRAAQIAALALGWRLFERYLIAAGGLESIPLQDLRDEVTALNRRIGATPWPFADEGPPFPVARPTQYRDQRLLSAASPQRLMYTTV